eukprot:c45602_g1_i1 orf=9-158(-)
MLASCRSKPLSHISALLKRLNQAPLIVTKCELSGQDGIYAFIIKVFTSH